MVVRVCFDEWLADPRTDKPHDLLALDQALQGLAAFDAREARLVELRFFGSLSVDETAVVLGVSAQTVHRDWALAKSWLAREIHSSPA